MRLARQSLGLGALAGALAVLLALLAVLQYRWTGDIGRAERDRMRRGLDASANALADDFDREISRAFHTFRLGGDGDRATLLADRWRRWNDASTTPGLIATIYLVEPPQGPPPDIAPAPDNRQPPENAAPGAGFLAPNETLPPPPAGPPGDRRPPPGERPPRGMFPPDNFRPPEGAPPPEDRRPPGARGPRGGPMQQGDMRHPDNSSRPNASPPPRPAAPSTNAATENGMRRATAREALYRFDTSTGRLQQCEWPPALDDVKRMIAAPVGAEAPADAAARYEPIVASIPALVVPISPGPADARQPLGGRGPGGWVVLVLDGKSIESSIVPSLAERHLPGYDVVVRDPSSVRIIASIVEGGAMPRRVPDATFGIFEVRPFPELAGMNRSLGLGPPPMAAGRGAQRRETGSGAGARPTGVWVVETWHRAGSFDVIVARNRARNLALSGLVLAMLVLSAILLIASARRSDRIARQQMEFIAGVTHELNTPIAAVSSAGQNLADGIITEEAQVRRYGEMITREGRRLSGMVGQILQFAGIQGGDQHLNLRQVQIEEVIDSALGDVAWMIEEQNVRVEKSIDAGIPPVAADATQLSRAIQNLVSNAIKYGGTPPWVRVSARLDSARRAVVVEVRDRGIGIEKSDLPNVFEPFYRGRAAAISAARGSGLGLSIVRQVVEAHGGRVTVSSASGRGSTFSITLPLTEGA